MAAGSMKGNILVVDDEETIGIGISEILKDEGFEAAYVVNGSEAVEAVRKKGYRLIFMDVVMPGMNGLETYRGIRKIRPDAKVILFTGYFRDAEDVISGVKEGMIDEFIRKPYFADEIIRAARKKIPHGRPRESSANLWFSSSIKRLPAPPPFVKPILKTCAPRRKRRGFSSLQLHNATLPALSCRIWGFKPAALVSRRRTAGSLNSQLHQ